MAMPAPVYEDLASFAEAVADCTRCPLSQGRTQVVFGAGNPHADLMFVGEAPGFHEDKQGVPFVGAAGQLLGKLLAEIGLQRDDVYIANVLKCLRYDARVQLGDGSWERIGRLVRSRYDGTVMSLSAEGELVPRRVTGWHATPLAGRRVFRLTYRSAKRAGAGRTSIQLTGDHRVLTRRGYVEAQALRSDDLVAIGQGLSAVAGDVVIGTLLGDGSIAANRSHLAFGHSASQAEYAAFKAAALAELCPETQTLHVAAVSGGPAQYAAVHVRTRADRSLRVLREHFYGGKKRVPEWFATELSPRMLAIWFMDDGHLRLRDGRRPRAEIATNAFGTADLWTLRHGLLLLGIPATIARGRLHFDVHATRRLSEVIAPYVPPSMRYKLHPEAAAAVPFDPTNYEPGPPRTLYDYAEVEDVTDHPRTDTTFFCLDVEETHNFVTAGGVVHNCRPPGNRDPLPEEIAACESHLFKQLELIRPKVVATLGNFATKLLSGRPDGITRVHGRPQQVVLGGNAVTLYPIFHPAAALYTPRMLETLQQDFARIPALIGHEPEPLPAPAPVLAAVPAQPEQLGLF
jgi:uracil-DNA glycosylase